ncbi:hypothetical protein F0562_008392 [Nyssa sinensis]|uniref:PGG domain-containing protein n=1 Tax=Nyssa sinensis TaxID=561372 RepID=A0A5J5A5K7_9ASTE|nr:hypothetical protein F0562_008392 [Nyssa sinensis]
MEELYNAVVGKKKDKVIELCRKSADGPLRIITIHKDTVIHMAAYTEQADLVLKLVDALPENQGSKISEAVNDAGNTILHEAATSNKLVQAAEAMLRKAPELLSKENDYKETALFRAVNYGKIDMFKFLDGEVNKKFRREEAYKRFHCGNDNKTTILHVAILAAQFELAYLIAENYSCLISQRDGNEMTALQHLSRDEATFNNGAESFVTRFINSCVSTKDTTEREDSSAWRLPWWEEARKEVKKYNSALKLARLLIAKDSSWKITEQLVEEKVKEASSSSVPLYEEEEKNGDQKSRESKKKCTPPTPLFLATIHGCVDIVKEILKMYPQAIEHVDGKGRTILHVAIKYRQIEIFSMVEAMEIPMKRLVRKCDKDSNSILHMVGLKARNCKGDDTRSPALQLQEEWHLFERVRNICSNYFFRYINRNKETAEQVFAKKNKKLCGEAKEWLKRTAENSSIVAVLIATVAFAAAYTVPGGSDQITGVPILLNQPFFIVFTITDVLSLTFALTSCQ